MFVETLDIPLEKLVLDVTNPRIAKFMETYGDSAPTVEMISLALGAGDSQSESGSTSFQSLKASIRTNGGIISPIIVNKINDDKYVVIEGNTRLKIYMEFQEDDVEGKWDKIKAIIHENMSNEQIDSIRLQAHLVGPRPWDPYSKAKYLEYLSNSAHLTITQIIDYCGGRETEIKNYINGYIEMEKHYRPQLDSDQDFDHTRYSAFVEVQNPRIRDAIFNSGHSLDDFSKWVRDRKIYPLEKVRRLPSILGNKRSRDIFLKHPGKGAIEEALKVLNIDDSAKDLNDASLIQLVAETVKRVLNLPYEQLTNLKSKDALDEVQIIFDARDLLVELCRDIERVDE